MINIRKTIDNIVYIWPQLTETEKQEVCNIIKSGQYIDIYFKLKEYERRFINENKIN